MVRTRIGLTTGLVAAIVASASASGASVQAQDRPVDWRAAGGDLFGRETVTETAPAELSDPPPRLPDLDQPYAALIADAATRHALDPKLLHAVVIVESAYNPGARSPVGAGGLTQLMPGTAADLGVRNRFDPADNLRGGADYLARQMLRFGDLRLALAAYNAGPGRVARLGRIPEIAETRAYVASVIDCYLTLTVGQVARTASDCQGGGRRR